MHPVITTRDKAREGDSGRVRREGRGAATRRRVLPLALLVSVTGMGCAGEDPGHDTWDAPRKAMVETLRDYGISDGEVLRAMSAVERHHFIPESFRHRGAAYGDHPLPIGHGQTISQPYIVAYMTEKMKIQRGEKILEIGTGSGYQAAVLAELGARVYSIEIVPPLAEHARRALTAAGYKVQVLTGDGYKGWPSEAPFDVIIVTCAPADVPQALVGQLAEGGRMIVPAGRVFQRLLVLRKKDGKVHTEQDLAVRFVPMVPGDTD